MIPKSIQNSVSFKLSFLFPKTKPSQFHFSKIGSINFEQIIQTPLDFSHFKWASFPLKQRILKSTQSHVLWYFFCAWE